MIPENATIETSFGYRQMDLSVDILIRNIEQIRNVNEWSRLIGYSRAHFCRRFTQKFGENPKMVMRRARFRKICRVIQSDWSATAYKVALESGLLNEKALHKFLSRNFDLGFTSLKDLLKRNAFRSRNYQFLAAEDESVYAGIPLNLTDRFSSPGNHTFEQRDDPC